MRQLVVFNIIDNKYCIDIFTLNEILSYQKPSQVPESPDFIEGITNLRGKIITLLNLRKRLSLPDVELDENFKIIILNMPNIKAGIIVDSVSEILKVDEDNIISADNNERLKSIFAKSLIKHNDEDIYLLDIESLFSYAKV